jgi:hypothetical protein
MSSTYYCNVKNEDLTGFDGMKVYNFWKNCGFMMVVMLLLGLITFSISYLLHRIKLWGA